MEISRRNAVGFTRLTPRRRGTRPPGASSSPSQPSRRRRSNRAAPRRSGLWQTRSDDTLENETFPGLCHPRLSAERTITDALCQRHIRPELATADYLQSGPHSCSLWRQSTGHLEPQWTQRCGLLIQRDLVQGPICRNASPRQRYAVSAHGRQHEHERRGRRLSVFGQHRLQQPELHARSGGGQRFGRGRPRCEVPIGLARRRNARARWLNAVKNRARVRTPAPLPRDRETLFTFLGRLLRRSLFLLFGRLCGSFLLWSGLLFGGLLLLGRCGLGVGFGRFFLLLAALRGCGGRFGRLRLGHQFVADELENRHLGGITTTRAEFDDAGVTTRTLREAGTQRAEELRHHGIVLNHLRGIATSVNTVVLAERNELLDQRPELLRFRQCRHDALVADERGQLVPEHRHTMA